MQLKDMEEVASVTSEGFLWCNGEPQAALKMCAVNLVDFRKTHGLNAQIMAEENPPAKGQKDVHNAIPHIRAPT